MGAGGDPGSRGRRRRRRLCALVGDAGARRVGCRSCRTGAARPAGARRSLCIRRLGRRLQPGVMDRRERVDGHCRCDRRRGRYARPRGSPPGPAPAGARRHVVARPGRGARPGVRAGCDRGREVRLDASRLAFRGRLEPRGAPVRPGCVLRRVVSRGTHQVGPGRRSRLLAGGSAYVPASGRCRCCGGLLHGGGRLVRRGCLAVVAQGEIPSLRDGDRHRRPDRRAGGARRRS